MANTGIETVLTLKEVEAPCPPPFTGCVCAPGCPTKPNVPNDPDYIAPYQNLTNCPISYTTTCPDVVATGAALSVVFEFALLNSVIENPALDKVKIKAMLAAVEQGSVTFTFPGPSANWFSGTITGLAAATTYDIEIDYLDAADVVVANCPSLASVTTS